MRNVRSRAGVPEGEGPLRVKMSKARDKHMFSGLPPIADLRFGAQGPFGRIQHRDRLQGLGSSVRTVVSNQPEPNFIGRGIVAGGAGAGEASG